MSDLELLHDLRAERDSLRLQLAQCRLVLEDIARGFECEVGSDAAIVSAHFRGRAQGALDALDACAIATADETPSAPVPTAAISSDAAVITDDQLRALRHDADSDVSFDAAVALADYVVPSARDAARARCAAVVRAREISK